MNLPFMDNAWRDPGDLNSRNADLVEQGISGRSGPGEDVSSPVQPVGAPALRANPPAGTPVRLQQERIPVTQAPPGRKTGESSADDDYIFHSENFHSRGV